MNKAPLIFAAALGASIASAASAQLEITWSSIDCGGNGLNTVMGSDSYRLGGAIGEPDAGPSSSASYSLIGGYWAVRQPCPGDADGNGEVNFTDVALVLGNFGVSYIPGTGLGDADGTGTVNFADISSILSSFGSVCPPF